MLGSVNPENKAVLLPAFLRPEEEVKVLGPDGHAFDANHGVVDEPLQSVASGAHAGNAQGRGVASLRGVHAVVHYGTELGVVGGLRGHCRQRSP